MPPRTSGFSRRGSWSSRGVTRGMVQPRLSSGAISPERADRGDLGARGHGALGEAAGADGLGDLVLAPADLDVEVDLHVVERRLGEGVERLVERERRLAVRRAAPQSWATRMGPAPFAGPAGAVRQSDPSAKSSGGRSTSNSIASTPTSTAAWKLSIELPGTIASAPLCPTRSMRGEDRLRGRGVLLGRCAATDRRGDPDRGHRARGPRDHGHGVLRGSSRPRRSGSPTAVRGVLRRGGRERLRARLRASDEEAQARHAPGGGAARSGRWREARAAPTSWRA